MVKLASLSCAFSKESILNEIVDLPDGTVTPQTIACDIFCCLFFFFDINILQFTRFPTVMFCAGSE